MTLLFAILALTIKTSLAELVGLYDDALPTESKNTVLIIAEDAKSIPADLRQQGEVEFSAETLEGRISEEDAELIKTAEGRKKLAKRAIRRYMSSPIPPLFSPEEDPFCLKEHVAMSFANAKEAVLPYKLEADVVNDIDKLIANVSELKRKAEAAGVMITGVPVHTALSASACKREIGYLTAFSLVFIVCLSFWVFRSWRWLPYFAVSLLASSAVGFSAVIFVVFESVHLMTFVFGTTVLGLVIDYSFHALLTTENRKTLIKNLVISWATTEISFLPLMLSSVAVLRQTAVFLATALSTALAVVIFVYPKVRKVRLDDRPMWKSGIGVKSLLAVLMLALIAFAWPLKFKTEIKSLYTPPKELLKADRIVAERWRAIPEITEAQAKDIKALYDEQGAGVAEALGLEAPGTYLRRSSLEDSPQVMLSALLTRLTYETSRGLAIALALMFGVLAVIFRAGAVRKFLPSLLAIIAMLGVVQLSEGSINLFHLIAFFLLAGISIDYTIFIHGAEDRRALFPIVCSLLTSMAGFGALYFVSFEVVKSFGLVLGLGLPLAFMAALVLKKGEKIKDGTEKAASPLGLETLFLLYRMLGLRVLHFGAAVVGISAWLFSRGVRRSSPSIKKTMLFTRSLADKLVIMADGKRLPKVMTDGSPDAEEFIAEVKAKKGVFILSSHCGTVETLVALGETEATFHAWMDIARTSVFNAFYLRHSKRRRVVIHPISEIGMETAFFAADALERGDSLVMAGDRGRGAFRFAASLDCKAFFVACVADGSVEYKAIIRRLPEGAKAMEKEYQRILAEVTSAYPDQWFEWEK